MEGNKHNDCDVQIQIEIRVNETSDNSRPILSQNATNGKVEHVHTLLIVVENLSLDV